jgi:hypothetical protein
MDMLASTRAGGRKIKCGLASTRPARAEVQAQPFRTEVSTRSPDPSEQPSAVELLPSAHPDPVVLVQWLVAEIAPSIEQATSMYDFRYTPVSAPIPLPRHGNEPQGTA